MSGSPETPRPVHQELIVSEHLPLTTRTGFEFHVRPVTADDKESLAEFFTHVTKEDLRFRFLSGLPEVSDSLLEQLINVDHDQKEDYLAFDIDNKTIIASAMLGIDNKLGEAEVAIIVRSDYKNRGMSWTFLSYIVDEARRAGVQKLTSLESRDNHKAIALEKEMGFVARSCPEDPTLVELSFDLSETPIEA